MAGQIAAGVAHEIKNPLASIKGAADILADDASSTSERTEFRDILQGEVKRIDGTIKEFLNFARPRDTQLAPLNLSEALKSGIRQLAAPAEKEGVLIESDLNPDVKIMGDSEKLHQLILNLLLNAVHASPRGGQVAVVLKPEDSHRVRLTVTDQGTGIESDHLEHIFEPFFTTQNSGTGLGLAIAKAIVDDHNGSIEARSSVGTGTTVHVEFPELPAGGVD
jgi:signal transduction histidine kinase